MYPGEAKGISPFSENMPVMTFDMPHCRTVTKLCRSGGSWEHKRMHQIMLKKLWWILRTHKDASNYEEVVDSENTKDDASEWFSFHLNDVDG